MEAKRRRVTRAVLIAFWVGVGFAWYHFVYLLPKVRGPDQACTAFGRGVCVCGWGGWGGGAWPGKCPLLGAGSSGPVFSTCWACAPPVHPAFAFRPGGGASFLHMPGPSRS